MSNKIDLYFSNKDFLLANLSSEYDNSNSLVVKDDNFLTLFKSFFKFNNFYSNCIFSPGLLHYDDSIIIFEKPPCKKTINYIAKQESDIRYSDEYSSYEINIPWQVYIVKYSTIDYPVEDSEKINTYSYIDSVYMFFSNSQINSQDDFLYTAPIPNFYSNGLLCAPSYSSVEDVLFLKDDNYINNLINSAYISIWSSNFNGDLTSSLTDYLYSCYRSYIKSDNSIFMNSMIHKYIGLSHHSYYCDLQYVHSFLSNWSEYSVFDVLSFEWANPSVSNWYHSDYNSLQESNLYDYFISNSEYEISEEEISENEILEIIDYDDFLEFIGGDIRLNKKSLLSIVFNIKYSNFNKKTFKSFFSSLYNAYS
jgi:hypothetical protein